MEAEKKVTMETKKERIKELTKLLDKAARVYEQEDREIMSNFEYDKLYDELKALEEETGFILAGSPTMHAGYEILSELPKERHDTPMLSLDKTKDVETLKELIEYAGDRIIVMPGGGINSNNREEIEKLTGAKELHGTKIV